MTTRLRPRSRAFAPLWAILLIGAALLIAVVPVAAKDNVSVELTTKIPRDATPGSTLLVEWDAFVQSPVRRDPIYGSPIFIRLLAVGAGTATEADGHEQPSGSGHYAAEIKVPATGVRNVELGWRGENCEAGKGCTRNDMLMRLVGRVMVAGTDPAAATVVSAVAAPVAIPTASPAAVATAAASVTKPVAPTGTPVVASGGIDPAWLVGIGVVVIAAIAALALAARRRGTPTTPLTPGATRT
jgi:hypothetical protein